MVVRPHSIVTSLGEDILPGPNSLEAWSPAVLAGTIGDLTTVVNTSAGQWCRMGNVVLAEGYLDFTPTFTGAASGNLLFGNFPMTPLEIQGAHRYVGAASIVGSGNNSPVFPTGTTSLYSALQASNARMTFRAAGSDLATGSLNLLISSLISGNRYVSIFSTRFFVASTATLPVAFVTAGTITGSSSADTCTPALPAAVVVGNILFAVVASKNNISHTWPGNWTKLGQQHSGASFTMSWGWRVIVAGTDAPVVTVGTAVATAGVCVQIKRANASPIGASASGFDTSTAHTAPTITTEVAGSRAIYFTAKASNTGFHTQPTGWVEFSDQALGSAGIGIAIGGKRVVAAEATVDAIAVADSVAWAAAQVEIKPV